METRAARPTHPFVIIAAISVTLFSLVGIGAILGWIPTSAGGGATAPAVQVPEQPKADVVGPLAEAPAQPAAEAPKPPAPKRVARQANPRPKHVAKAEPPLQVAKAGPAQQAIPDAVPPPPPPVVAAPCRECAVIEEVREIEKAGQGSGAGAVAGGLVGGVLGHQVGSGRGNDVATVLGAIGGAIAGNQIEKNVKKVKEYRITVRYEDGSRGLFTQDTPPAWRPGDKVRIVDGAIRERG